MVEASTTAARTAARKNDELAATVVLGLVFQALLSYVTYLDGGLVGTAAGLAGPYVAFVVLVGTVQGLLELPRFKVALFAGWAILLGIGHALEPSSARLLVGGVAAAAATYYARRLRSVPTPTAGR